VVGARVDAAVRARAEAIGLPSPLGPPEMTKPLRPDDSRRIEGGPFPVRAPFP
jgi:hypothetical protein